MDPLREELLKPEYQGLTDQEAADAIMAKTVQVRKLVPLASVVQHASQKHYRAKLELARLDANHPGRETAINILEYINSPRMQFIDMDLPEVQEMRLAIVFFNFASQDMMDELNSMADNVIPWVEYTGIGVVGVGLVRNARK